MLTSTKSKKAIGLIITLCMVLSLFMVAMTTASHAASKNKYWIQVDKKRHYVTVYRKYGGKWKPVRTMICAVGVKKKRSNATPSGSYRIGDRHRWFHMINTKFGIDSWAQYASHIGRSCSYIHSPSYDGPKHNLSRNSYQKSLGRSVTHGCVRLRNIDCLWIWNNCPKGTKVTVGFKTYDKSLGSPQFKKGIDYFSTSGHNWEPTDPDKRNPHFMTRAAIISFNSSYKPVKTVIQRRAKQKAVRHTIKYVKKNVPIGSNQPLSYKKAGVSAKNPNCNQNISNELKSYVWNGKSYASNSWIKNVKQSKYAVRYYIRDKYCTQNGQRGESSYAYLYGYDQPTIKVETELTPGTWTGKALFDAVTAKGLTKIDYKNKLKVTVNGVEVDLVNGSYNLNAGDTIEYSIAAVPYTDADAKAGKAPMYKVKAAKATVTLVTPKGETEDMTYDVEDTEDTEDTELDSDESTLSAPSVPSV